MSTELCGLDVSPINSLPLSIMFFSDRSAFLSIAQLLTVQQSAAVCAWSSWFYCSSPVINNASLFSQLQMVGTRCVFNTSCPLNVLAVHENYLIAHSKSTTVSW